MLTRQGTRVDCGWLRPWMGSMEEEVRLDRVGLVGLVLLGWCLEEVVDGLSAVLLLTARSGGRLTAER